MKPSGERRGASSATISRRVMKKPLIGSVTADARDAAEEPGAEFAELLARRREAAGRALVGDARADREVAFARGERRVHFRQDRFVVLQVAVDHGDEIGARGQPALDHRAGEPGAVDAPEAAQARIAARRSRRRRRRCRRANCRRRRPSPTAGPRASSSAARTAPERSPPRDRSARSTERVGREVGLRRDRMSSRARRILRRAIAPPLRSTPIGHGKGARQAARREGSRARFRPARRGRRRRVAAGRSSRNSPEAAPRPPRAGRWRRRSRASRPTNGAVVEKRHAARIGGEDEDGLVRARARAPTLPPSHHLVTTTKSGAAEGRARRAARPNRAIPSVGSDRAGRRRTRRSIQAGRGSG